MDTQQGPWDETTRALWARIDTHPIGGADGAPALFRRLQRERGWSAARAAAALREYRRFAFLCCVAPDEMTPSLVVDAVWHTHLLFTLDYWDGFCTQALRRPLHHAPALAGGDAARHHAQYLRTRSEYARWFGAPPASCWPERRPRRARWLRRAAAAFGALLAPALAAAQAGNPLQWSGREFLELYIPLMFVVLVLTLLWRHWLRRQAQSPSRRPGALSTSEIAYLAGGPQRALDAAVAELHERDVLAWDSRHGAFTAQGDASRLEPPLPGVARALGGYELRTGTRSALDQFGAVRESLEARGLWLGEAVSRRIGRLAALPPALLLAFGLAKVAIGLARDRPVGFLLALCALVAVFTVAMYAARPRRTAAGTRELQRLQREHGAAARRGGRDEPIGLAVALGGTAILAGTALAAYHEVRAATAPSSDGGSSSSFDASSDRDASDSDSSSGSSDSSDSGGGGCGGCGGGGGD